MDFHLAFLARMATRVTWDADGGLRAWRVSLDEARRLPMLAPALWRRPPDRGQLRAGILTADELCWRGAAKTGTASRWPRGGNCHMPSIYAELGIGR